MDWLCMIFWWLSPVGFVLFFLQFLYTLLDRAPRSSENKESVGSWTCRLWKTLQLSVLPITLVVLTDQTDPVSDNHTETLYDGKKMATNDSQEITVGGVVLSLIFFTVEEAHLQ